MQCESDELFTLLPKPLRRLIVLRRRVGRPLPAIIKILAACAVEFARGSDINQCVGAAFNWDCRHPLGNRKDQAPDAAIIVSKAAGNKARVQGICSDASSLKTPCQFACEQD